MSLNLLNNNDSGLVARTKINETIDVVNTISGSTNAIVTGQSGFTGSFLGTSSWAENNIYSASIPPSSNEITFFTPLTSFTLTVDTGSGGGGGGTPGGSDTQIQFNSGSEFSGSGKFTYDYTADKLTFSGSIYTSGSTIGGGSGHVLTYNTSSGQVFFTASSAIGGGGTPGGDDKAIQFKSGSVFSGSIDNLKYDYTSLSLAFSGSEFSASGSIKFPTLITSSLSYTSILTLDTSSGQLYYTSSNAVTSPQLKSGSFGITLDGNGSVLTPGEKGYLAMPCSGTITNWAIAVDQTQGTPFTVNFYTSSFTEFGAGTSGSIQNLQLAASSRISSGTLSVPFTDKSVITFRVPSVSTTITRATVTVNYIKS